MPDLQEEHGEQTASMEGLEQSQLEQEIAQVDRTLEDMEMKVNVLRWTVEAQGPQYSEPLSTDSASLGLLCTDVEEAQVQFCDRSQMFMVMLLGGVAATAVVLSLCVVLLVWAYIVWRALKSSKANNDWGFFFPSHESLSFGDIYFWIVNIKVCKSQEYYDFRNTEENAT